MGSLTLCQAASLCLHPYPVLPGQARPGASPFSSPRVQPREKRSPLTPQSPLCLLHLYSSLTSRTLPPAQEAAGKSEQQAPKMCHCAECFQTLQDVTVSQFQFIRWRREDARDIKALPFPIETGAALLISAPSIPPRLIFTCTTQTYGDPVLDSAICSGALFLASLLFFGRWFVSGGRSKQ